jgi:vacuolar-type H+-ATPase subunit I/STV1
MSEYVSPTRATPRPTPSALFISILGVAVLVLGLIFGIRDAWVNWVGINGSAADGALLAVFTGVPAICVLACLVQSRKRTRSTSATLFRAGMVALLVGCPVTLALAVAAAY